jgi:hypothetical protein
MNQSDVIDLSTEEEYPPDFDLQLVNNEGWKGGNENFRVLGNVIKIKQSDGDATIVPTMEQRQKMYDREGNYSQHRQLFPKSPIFQLWMRKIGPYLADWVLDMRNDRAWPPPFHKSLFLTRRDATLGTALTIPWRLIGFPTGYTLWVHLTGDHADPANPRTDVYLYGSPHKIFRSPMEFVEHAIWLMKGGDRQCLCKYCTPGQSQRAINHRLNHGGAGNDDDDDSGGDGAAAPHHHIPVADINATRHPLFRDRPGAGLAAAAAATARRRARRDLSSGPINAKDYRTWNYNDGGAGGGAGGMAA